jgi:hypothetical protein
MYLLITTRLVVGLWDEVDTGLIDETKGKKDENGRDYTMDAGLQDKTEWIVCQRSLFVKRKVDKCPGIL